MSAVLELARALIERPSVTPEDAGCQALVADYLKPFGFAAEDLSANGVTNTWYRRGAAAPRVAFAGHTDVVPPGPAARWRSGPFAPEVRGGLLYGRGAADMKGAVAAMAVACARRAEARPDDPVALLLTSDEEGPAEHGTRAAAARLADDGRLPARCVVGEPSCAERLGDTIKHGRRGSLGGRLTVRGAQGHIAYPELCANPIHRFAPALQRLCDEVWDAGDEHFPPTRLQFSNVAAGAGALNVIPGELTADFNLRHAAGTAAEDLRARIHALLDAAGLDYAVDWLPAGAPYLTEPGALTGALQEAVRETLGAEAALSTSGGTSDGRFLSAAGCEVAEFGPVNRSIHQVDEHVAVDDLEALARVYETLLERLPD